MSITGMDIHAEGTLIQPQRVTILNVDLLMFELRNKTNPFEAPLRFIRLMHNVCSVWINISDFNECKEPK
jgi:hypothetical protein